MATQPPTLDDVIRKLAEIRRELRRVRRFGFATPIAFFASFALAGVLLLIQAYSNTSLIIFYGWFLIVVGLMFIGYYLYRQSKIHLLD